MNNVILTVEAKKNTTSSRNRGKQVFQAYLHNATTGALVYRSREESYDVNALMHAVALAKADGLEVVG